MEYDMALPRTLAEFTDFQVENADNVIIDRDNRTVTIELNEKAYLSDVKITSFALNKNARFAAGSFPEVLDLTSPQKVVLSMYYDFEWTISAMQKVSRYVKCSGQIGNAFFDVDRKEAYVYVSDSQRLTELVINSAKFELEGSQVMYDGQPCTFPMPLDCTVKQRFTVISRGQTIEWTLTAIPREVPAQIVSISPWCWSADIKATYDGGSSVPSVQYKEKTAAEWSEVPSDKVVVDGINITASVEGLDQTTQYDVRLLLNGGEVSAGSFLTDTPVQLPNSSFEYVSLVSGQQFYKFYDPSCSLETGSVKFWASGNGDEQTTGSLLPATFAPITVPDTEEYYSGDDGKHSVRAQSMEVMGIKLAAGNLFAGQFVRTEGTNGGIVNFGQPWTTRPVAVKFRSKYITGTMGKYSGTAGGVSFSSEDYDRAQIKVALGTWDPQLYGGTAENPLQVNTTRQETFVDFYNDTKGGTLANGDVVVFHDGYQVNKGTKVNADTGVWTEYTIPLDYKGSDKLPTHIIISCSASQYGDYFIGSTSSRLWLDAFELIYK